jgi:predicted DCC family thiol-disulfide oxidoreductase YuxK
MIVPRFIRDAVYDFIAVRRYRWFGQRQACMVPTPQTRKRFLE